MEQSRDSKIFFLRGVFFVFTVITFMVYWNQSAIANPNAPIRDGWKLFILTILLDIFLIPLVLLSIRFDRIRIPSFCYFLIVNIIGFSGGGPEGKMEIGLMTCIVFGLFLVPWKFILKRSNRKK